MSFIASFVLVVVVAMLAAVGSAYGEKPSTCAAISYSKGGEYSGIMTYVQPNEWDVSEGQMQPLFDICEKKYDGDNAAKCKSMIRKLIIMVSAGPCYVDGWPVIGNYNQVAEFQKILETWKLKDIYGALGSNDEIRREAMLCRRECMLAIDIYAENRSMIRGDLQQTCSDLPLAGEHVACKAFPNL